MTTYELETGTLMFIPLPEEADSFEIFLNKLYYRKKGFAFDYLLQELPSLGFKPLSLFSQLKEEDVKEVMPKLGRDWFYYSEFGHFKTALESIHSLAQHLGLNVNPLQDPNDKDCTTELCTMEEWQQAQSKVKQYFVAFKAKEK